MSDDLTIEGGGDGKGATERLAAFRQALVEADEADVILLSGMSREDWLVQIDRAAGGSGG